MKELLDDAKTNKYCIGYYNGINTEMTRAYIRAAEDTKSPIIIGTAEGLLKYCDFDWIAPMMLNAARNSKVPVAVHFDHAYSFEIIMKALRHGFGSVMFDGSALSPEDNISISAEISKIAHHMGVGFEGELGKVGGLEEGNGVIGTNQLTDPSMAADFVERTGVDFLAVSIGTTHGIYTESPNLDLALLADIRSKTDVALVLHGGSGLADDDYKNCIAGGIQKINMYTDLVSAATEVIRENAASLDYIDLSQITEAAMYDIVVSRINVFGSGNRA